MRQPRSFQNTFLLMKLLHARVTVSMMACLWDGVAQIVSNLGFEGLYKVVGEEWRLWSFCLLSSLNIDF